MACPVERELVAIEFADRVPISIVRTPIVFGEGDLDGLMIGKAMGIEWVLPWPNLPTTIWLIGAFSEAYARVSGRPQIMNWGKRKVRVG